jgi:hypothetical protein
MNNTPFMFMNNRGKEMSEKDTHKVFIECLEPTMLNEFLLRFQNKEIVKDILEKRLQDNRVNKNIIIDSRAVYKPGDISAYVNYKLNGNTIFHVSFHLCYNRVEKGNGMLHFKQQNGSSRLIKVCYRSNSSFRKNNSGKQYPKSLHFCIGNKHDVKSSISDMNELEASHIIDVLNEYFNEHHEKYVGIKSNRKAYNKLNRSYKNIQNSLKRSAKKGANRSNNYTRRNKRV